MLCFDVLKSVLTRTCLICVLSLLTHVCSKVCVLMCVLSLSHVLNCGFPFVVLIPLSCVSALESVLSSVCLHACALTCACSPVSVLPSCVVNFVCSPMCSRVCVCVCVNTCSKGLTTIPPTMHENSKLPYAGAHRPVYKGPRVRHIIESAVHVAY